ncbi:MAG: hypothetical protein ACK2UM_03730 [Anaerolineales bacterium]|jgi:hypothetical protein
MLKKIVIGILLATVIGAVGIAVAYNLALKEPTPVSAAPAPLADDQDYSSESTGSQQVEQMIAAQGSVGESWLESGTIVEIDDFGIQFELQDGETVYIELGPPDYWQSQGIELQVGQTATVAGSVNQGMIHASQVLLSDGQALNVRSETGQPLWSGGVTNGMGQNGSNGDGDRIPEPQAAVDEWITIEGTLMSFQGGNMTMNTPDGEIITFQTGQPRFFAGQNVSLQVGDEIVVVGFYEGEQFMAGDITQTATGLKVMLRDPNGRPLWAGPGGNGNGNRGNQNGRGSAGSTP